MRLAVEPHRIADAEAVFDRHRAAERERTVPAHRIAEGRDDVILFTIDRQIVERGRGVDQRRRNLAAHMPRDAETPGPADFGHTRLTARSEDTPEGQECVSPCRT